MVLVEGKSLNEVIFKLLEMILYEARKFTNCDAGTFYRLSKNKKFLNKLKNQFQLPR